MKKKEPNLLDLYYNDQKEQLLYKLHDIITKVLPVPVEDILHILSETSDIDIIGLSLEVLYANHEALFPELVKFYNNTDEHTIKLFILIVLCIHPTFQSMNFIIKEYLKQVDFRSLIRNMAFKNKSRLLLGLARYIETHSITKEEEETVQDILTTIPRTILTKTAGTLSSLKIMDIYYSIPPKKRRMD